MNPRVKIQHPHPPRFAVSYIRHSRVGGGGWAMKFYLIVAKGRKRGFPIAVEVDLFLIGSDKMCQLRKPSLGPKHCAFVTRDKKVFTRDMDSGRETLVNGFAIPAGEEWPIYAGDVVGVGPLEFLV